MRKIAPWIVAAAVALPSAAIAQSAPDVADLVGARGAGGETQLLARGYESRGSNVVRDTRYVFWWNARTGRCISVATADGRYSAITAVPAENCASGGEAAHGMAPLDHDDRRGDTGFNDPNSLVLVCYGAGTRPTVTAKPSYKWNPWDHKWEWGTEVGNSAKGFNSDIQIELYGDHGRIHLAPKMISPIHSGGENGWWDLDNLVVTPDKITASYRLNGMNKPKLTVDRRTGRVTIQAVTNYSGMCDSGNWSAGQRRF